ncbi:unnamed protein product [Didymodactylos carnosus]|uniref:Uncharacterized protein n=1 Tax=Didymodactylos carnosus TaxID=1234261 RepID=A0A814I8Z9_9BILA|nr:unnamed protein product [Didymodactylos carnosus]CAF3791147.1 unnamed protein product [Didymodactylos carnosus]
MNLQCSVMTGCVQKISSGVCQANAFQQTGFVMDCSDAPDEEKLIGIAKFDGHNVEPGLNLIHMKQKCFEMYKDQPFSTICNISTEFPCMVDHSKDPLNFTINRPCIDLNRSGDVQNCHSLFTREDVLGTKCRDICSYLSQNTIIGDIDDRFKGKLIKSGNFHEQTKIGDPAQYDFMIDLEYFQQENLLV